MHIISQYFCNYWNTKNTTYDLCIQKHVTNANSQNLDKNDKFLFHILCSAVSPMQYILMKLFSNYS